MVGVETHLRSVYQIYRLLAARLYGHVNSEPREIERGPRTIGALALLVRLD